VATVPLLRTLPDRPLSVNTQFALLPAEATNLGLAGMRERSGSIPPITCRPDVVPFAQSAAQAMAAGQGQSRAAVIPPLIRRLAFD
jgi:hypothetical protein